MAGDNQLSVFITANTVSFQEQVRIALDVFRQFGTGIRSAAGEITLDLANVTVEAAANFSALNPAIQESASNYLRVREALQKVSAEVADTDRFIVEQNGLINVGNDVIAHWSDVTTSQILLQKELTSAMTEYKAVLSGTLTAQQAQAAAQAELAAKEAAARAERIAAIEATNIALAEEAAMGEGMVASDAEIIAAEEAAAVTSKEVAAARRAESIATYEASVAANRAAFAAAEVAAANEKAAVATGEAGVAAEAAVVPMTRLESAMAVGSGRVGAWELGLGQLGYAFGRIGAASSILGPILAATFPLLAIGAFAALIERVVTQFEKWHEATVRAQEDFYNLAISTEHTTDSLDLQNAQLQDSIDKLGGKPGDGLLVALEEVKVRADNLGKSLTDDLDKVDQLFIKYKSGILERVFTGVAPTADLQSGLEEYRKRITDIISAETEAIRSAKSLKEESDIKAAFAPEIAKAYGDAIGYVNQQLAAAKKQQAENDQLSPFQGGGVASGGFDVRPPVGPDETKNISLLTDVLKVYQTEAKAAADSQENLNLTIQKGAAQDTKGAAEAAKRAAAAEREAGNAGLRAAQENLDSLRASHDLSKADEELYWRTLAAAAIEGSTLYIGALDRANKAEIALNTETRKATDASARAAVTDRKIVDDLFIKNLFEDIKEKEELYRLDADNAIRDIETRKKLADITIAGRKEETTDNTDLLTKSQLIEKTQELAATEHNAALQELSDRRAVLTAYAAQIQAQLAMGADVLNVYRRIQEQIHEIDNEIAIENAQTAQKIAESYRKALKEVETDFASVGNKIQSGFIKVIDTMMTNGNAKFGREMAQMWNQLLVQAANYYARELSMDAAHWAQKKVLETVGTQALVVIENGLATVLNAIGLKTLAADLANLAVKQTQHAAAGAAMVAQTYTTDQLIVMKEAALAYAGAFASVMTALPFPANISVAPAVAGAAAAATLAGGSAALGAMLDRDTLVSAHAGEMIVPAGLSKQLMTAMSLPSSVSRGLSGLASNAVSAGSSISNSSSTRNQRISVEQNFNHQGATSPSEMMSNIRLAMKRGA